MSHTAGNVLPRFLDLAPFEGVSCQEVDPRPAGPSVISANSGLLQVAGAAMRWRMAGRRRALDRLDRWCGSLSHNLYDNNVAGITGNVLRRFLDPTAFET